MSAALMTISVPDDVKASRTSKEVEQLSRQLPEPTNDEQTRTPLGTEPVATQPRDRNAETVRVGSCPSRARSRERDENRSLRGEEERTRRTRRLSCQSKSSQ